MTIHDLRLEVDGRVAQINHLIIDRVLTIWVCESTHFSEGVAVDDFGECAEQLRKLVLVDGVFAEPAVRNALFPDSQ